MTPLFLLCAFLIASVIITAGALIMTNINISLYKKYTPAPLDQSAPRITVCIPARNEAANIEDCIRSILTTTHPNLSILIYDDQSTDNTPRLIDALIAQDPRISRVPTRPLPEGWVGKQWACERLARAAIEQGADWMVFTDADVRFAKLTIPAAHTAATSLRADLVSTFPRQITRSLAEQLFIPLIHFVLFSYLPFARMRSTNSPAASAGCGQFLMISRKAYEACGGHATWRDSMHDGIRMPREVRRAGLHSDLFDATEHLSCRMYHGFTQTWRGFVKNAYEGLGSLPLLIFVTLLHILGHLFPWVILIGALWIDTWRGAPFWLALTAIIIALVQRQILAARFQQSRLGTILHPIGILGMTIIQWHSFITHILGKRAWRGRESSSVYSAP